MDPNTHRNLMGAAGAGSEEASDYPNQQYMVQGMIGGRTGSGAVPDSHEVDWTVPEGVTSICAVAVGGGAGGEAHNSDPDGGHAGDLRYVNDISVTPGETLKIRVANGFWGPKNQAGSSGQYGFGNESYINRPGSENNGAGTNLVYARGGDGSGTNVGTGTDGTNGSDGSGMTAGGGGIAGGYSNNAQDANGGNSSSAAQSGGGVGLSGSNESLVFDGAGYPNTGGAFGGYAADALGPYAGCFGGGGGGLNTDNSGSWMTGNTASTTGAPGAVRIIWGSGRSFPTNAEGVYSTPDAGTELEIRLMTPMVYQRPSGTANAAATIGSEMIGLQVIDDNDNNLIGYTSNTANYLTATTGGSTARDGTTAKKTFDDLDVSGQTYGLVTYNIYTLTRLSLSDFEILLRDSGSTAYKQTLPLGPDRATTTDVTTDYSISDWAEDNEDYCYTNILCKFKNATVIKKIIFFLHRSESWVPRCKILMDGKVIANDYPAYRATNSNDGGRYYDNSGGNGWAARAAYFEFTD